MKSVFAYIAAFGLVSGLAEATPVVQPAGVCLTHECNHTANEVLKRMKDSVHPCENFYQFACGKYIDETPIPEDKVSVNTFQEVSDQLREDLKDIITKERTEGDPRHSGLRSDFYNACMNTSLIETLGSKPIEEISKELGGWPVILEDCWEASSWQETVKKFRQLGISTNYVVDLFIDLNLGNNAERIIFLDQPSLGLKREYLVNGVNHTFVKAYYDYMVDMAVLFGAEVETAKKELMESLTFEIHLAKISWPNLKRRNSTALYNLLSIKQLQESYPYVNWLDYINDLLGDNLCVENGEIINLSVPSYLKDLGQLVNHTSDRVIANYMMWRAHDQAVDHLSEKFRKRKMKYITVLTGKVDQGDRWKECVNIVSARFSASVGSEFVQKHFKPESKVAALEIVTNIRKAFGEILENAQWMDSATRKKAIEKLDLINPQIGYPDELLNNTIVEEYYRALDIDPNNYLKSSLMINIFQKDNSFNKLRLRKTKTDWTNFDRPAVVNAFYSRSENTIKFPAGIWRGYFFDINRPKYMIFGAMGSTIGHEITHAFDDRGSLYDGNGNLLDWWQNYTRNAYLERVKCIIQQYSDYTDQQTGLRINGRNTQGENIADNGGIKQSYLAYTRWLDAQDEDELRLPGLNTFTSQQMFWIATAQAECAKYRTNYLKSLITTGVHSPGEFRVLGPFSNIKEFSRDFKCDSGRRMNPTNKCAVW